MGDAGDFEQLGAFYLGRAIAADGQVTDEPILYDAKDLTTHAVCLGMTGSGKTGLCVSLLEEAAIDGIPAIAIDPKGDLANLLLTFPDLAPADFEPWIDPAEAAREGRSPAEHARYVAKTWREGLAQWGQDGARIARLRAAADIRIYTPGSEAGRPLTILRSFDAPPAALLEDSEAIRERVQATVSGLLALLGIDADPLRSREHILIANVVEHAWRDGRDLSLASLIREVQQPPFDAIGVFDLDTFFPATDRMDLAMALNNLLASPGFEAWRSGEPLSIDALLGAPDGRPRISILSIAHLSDVERMFFVTILLNEVVAWMRTQPGTSSLRALLYMDEVFGYFPPTANPPSKLPLLTLMKQARAFGLGVVLATQNPVDLDYKGLSNAGTWLLGRLQTERDKARVMEGLEGAAAVSGAHFDRAHFERLLAGLGRRVFLMHNAHDDAPVLFHTRWALSYLRGPLTRAQIARLCATDAADDLEPEHPVETVAAPEPRPVIPAGVEEHFVWPQGAAPAGSRLLYRATLFGSAQVHYANARAKVDHWARLSLQAPLDGALEGSPWTDAVRVGSLDLRDAPTGSPDFGPLAAAAKRPKTFARFSKMLASEIYRAHPLALLRSPDLKMASQAGESEAAFRARLRLALRETRDLERARLDKAYAPKLARLAERIRRADARVEIEQEQYEAKRSDALISVGATLVGALLGRKLRSTRNVGRATTAARGAQRAARERGDIARARETAQALRAELGELEGEFAQALAEQRDAPDAAQLELEPVAVRPRKSDTDVERVAIVWMPWWVDANGTASPASSA